MLFVLFLGIFASQSGIYKHQQSTYLKIPTFLGKSTPHFLWKGKIFSTDLTDSLMPSQSLNLNPENLNLKSLMVSWVHQIDPQITANLIFYREGLLVQKTRLSKTFSTQFNQKLKEIASRNPYSTISWDIEFKLSNQPLRRFDMSQKYFLVSIDQVVSYQEIDGFLLKIF